MAAPEYVPTHLDQQPRRGLPLPPPRPWTATRPADLGPAQPLGAGLGSPGPDQGYALVLAGRFEERMVVTEGEHVADAMAGCIGVALRRASIFGRAPVVHDLAIAFTAWGFLGDAPDELVALRRPLFQAASHGYWDQRAIVDQVPEETLRLSPAEVSQRFPDGWRALLGR
ncbi:MAG: hypothetical protein ACRDZ9_02035 [Acidimicrobiales bacterium]